MTWISSYENLLGITISPIIENIVTVNEGCWMTYPILNQSDP